MLYNEILSSLLEIFKYELRKKYVFQNPVSLTFGVFLEELTVYLRQKWEHK